MFLCSSVELAAAAYTEGIMGSLTRNHCRDIGELEAQLKTVAERVSRFAVGQRVGRAARSHLAAHRCARCEREGRCNRARAIGALPRHISMPNAAPCYEDIDKIAKHLRRK